MEENLVKLADVKNKGEDLLDVLISERLPLDSLSPEEWAIVQSSLNEIREYGSSSLHTALVEADFHRKPPTITDFITDPYYMGEVCNPNEEDNRIGLFPYWRTFISEAMDEGTFPNVGQLILTGAIGGGKTFTGVLCLLHRMARALCLRNPLLYYGVASTSKIVFNLFSVTQGQVKGGAFSDAVSALSASPFFREHILDNVVSRKFADRRVMLSRNLVLEAGSKVWEALGRNVIGSLIDEINFRIEKDAAKAAADLLTSVDRRYKSRFGHTDDGLLVVISSARSESDFLTSHVRAMRNNPKVRIADAPWWDIAGQVKPPGGKPYTGKKFTVDVGDSLHPAKILDLEEEITATPPNRILMVPDEHRESFVADLIGAIRDLGGVTTGRQAKFIYNLNPLINSIDDKCSNPFRGETLQFSIDQDHSLVDFLAMDRFTQILNGRAVPRRHPTAPRFIHFDMSTGAQDAMGVAMVHPVHMAEVERFNFVESRTEVKTAPVFELDFAIRLVRGPSREPLDIARLRTFIHRLKAHLGFKLVAISCDLWSLSHETRTIFKQMGYKSHYRSLDRNREGYDTFRQVLNEGRFRTFEHKHLFSELINLDDVGKTVDHPLNPSIPWKTLENGKLTEYLPNFGTKDVADGVAGAVWLAQSEEETYTLTFPDTMSERLLIQAGDGTDDLMKFKFGEELKKPGIRKF